MARCAGTGCLLLLSFVCAARAGVTVHADGRSMSVRAGEATLTVAPPEIRAFETTVKAPGDYAPHFDNWDMWPSGSKEQPLAVGVGPKRDEQNTHVLGGLYRSILPESLVVTSADGSRTFASGEDYRYEPDWGQIAGIDGRLGTPGEDDLKVRLRYATQRLDLVQIDAGGTPTLKQGQPRMVCPQLPAPDPGNRPVAGIYVAPWQREGTFVVAPEDVLPIAPAPPVRPINPQALDRARRRLAEDGSLTIAFLGDSVTLGAEAGAWWADLWTEKNRSYVSRVIVELRERHPRATVTPVHAARGGTTTKAAPGMFDETVAPARPDVVTIAFGLNDAFGPIAKPNNPPESFKEDVRAIVRKARDLGAEVILVTPMQPNPWTSLGVRMPAYRAALVELAKEEQVGCADVYTAWTQQADAGVPPFSQLHNWNNHPGSEAHAVYADAVLAFFNAVPSAGAAPEAAARPAASAPSATAPAATAPAGDQLMAQPTEIPGKFAFGGEDDTPPLPDLASVLAKAEPNAHIYGLYVWPGEYRDHRDSIRRVGWKSVRSGGTLDDDAMRRFAVDGVELMYTLGVSSDLRPRLANDPAAVEELLVRYPQRVRELLSRYGPGGTFFKENPDLPDNPLRHLEVTNEPNFQYVIPPDGRPQKELEAMREALYARLLPAAHAAVKEKWPDVRVVGFGAGGASAADARFIRGVHRLNDAVATSYDVLSTHPYVEPAPPEAYAIESWGRYSISGGLLAIRETLADHGRADAPVWYSEIGWPVAQADGGRFPTTKTTVTPMLQAAYVCRLYALAHRLGVERVHVMFATDTDNFNAGFFLPDGTWRPSAHAARTMIRLMPKPKLVGAISDGADGVFAYRFASGDATDAPVAMAWRVTGQSTLSVPVDGAEAVVTDLLGTERRVATTNGAVTIDVGPLPVYVREAR